MMQHEQSGHQYGPPHGQAHPFSHQPPHAPQYPHVMEQQPYGGHHPPSQYPIDSDPVGGPSGWQGNSFVPQEQSLFPRQAEEAQNGVSGALNHPNAGYPQITPEPKYTPFEAPSRQFDPYNQGPYFAQPQQLNMLPPFDHRYGDLNVPQHNGQHENIDGLDGLINRGDNLDGSPRGRPME